MYYRSTPIAEEAIGGRFGGVPVPIEAAAFPMSAGTMGPTEPAIRIRRDFPETWLWQMLESGYAV